MDTELDRKTANAWRSFMGSEEGISGLQWILSQRPPLDAEHWQEAAGFEVFHRRINDILEFESARARKDGDEREDKLRL